jgi:hypothetical protein
MYFGIPRTHLQLSIVNVSGEFQNTSAIFVIIGQILSWRCLLSVIHQFVSGYQGRIQDFKLGGALKNIAPSGGRRENFWGISCEKSRFYVKKKSHFFQF